MIKFNKPPVVETVLSAQFKPIEKLGAGLLGKFWASLGDEWPEAADAPSLEPEHEQFSSENAWQRGGFRFKVGSQADLRLQIFNVNRDRMIQIQNGRFLFNWIDNGETYPSYETVRPQFDEYWDRFREFLLKHSDQTLEVDQWEVVYVNHIAKNSLWSTASEIPNLFTFLGSASLETVQTNFETVGGEWRHEIPNHKGRLYVRLGATRKNEEPLIVLTLTSRGPVDGELNLSLDEGLALGHDTITRAFLGLTTLDAQQLWEPVHANSSTE